MSDERAAMIERETTETTITLELVIDGEGDGDADTGIAFYDHVLESFAKHGTFDLTVECDGDTEIDDHHTVEDVAIALGRAFDEALGDRAGIRRFADRRVPLDEAVASVVLDCSGRPHVEFRGEFSQAAAGEFTSDMARHVVRSLATNARVTLHAEIERGRNAHHEIEALFKCLARAFDDATRRDPRRSDTPSTKGQL